MKPILRCQILMSVLVILRIAGVVCGVFYGPYFYIVLCLTGLLLSGLPLQLLSLIVNYILPLGDIVLLFSLFQKTSDDKPSCDFPNQKVWIWIWEILNIFAIIGLLVALGMPTELI